MCVCLCVCAIIWLGYADDLMIVSETADGLQRAMTRLDEAMCRGGMSVNGKKTKVMLFGKTADAAVTVPKIVLRSGPWKWWRSFATWGALWQRMDGWIVRSRRG